MDTPEPLSKHPPTYPYCLHFTNTRNRRAEHYWATVPSYNFVYAALDSLDELAADSADEPTHLKHANGAKDSGDR